MLTPIRSRENPQVLIGGDTTIINIEITGSWNVVWYELPDGDATPDILEGVFWYTANTAPNKITDFDGNTNCIICVLGQDAFTTIEHDAAKIDLRGGIDTTLLAGQAKWFVNKSGIWYELPNP